MTGIAAPRVRGGPTPSALSHDDMTHVELTWIEKKCQTACKIDPRSASKIDPPGAGVGSRPAA